MNAFRPNPNLSPREVDNDRQEWLPIFPRERGNNATRFRVPVSFVDQLIERLEGLIREMFAGEDNAFSPNNDPSHLPQNYQRILSYLYKKGVIESPRIFFMRQFHDSPQLFYASIRGFTDPILTDGTTTSRPVSGGAASSNFTEAFSRAIGEFLERYALTLYRRKDFLRASVEKLRRRGKKHLDIFRLASFADWQKDRFPNRQFNETSNFFWAKGQELLSNTSALIPAQLVFWNYNARQKPEEPFLREPNTNGAAGHFTREEAIIAGIYELIQRDAFLIFWLNQIAPPRINLDTIKDPSLLEVLEKLKRYRFEVALLNTTLDLRIPSCICVLINQSDVGPKLTMGGGCNPNLERAFLTSITEAISVFSWLRDTKKIFTLPDNHIPFVSQEIDRENRILLGGNPDMFTRLRWFLSGREQSLAKAQNNFPLSFPAPRDELQYLLEVMKSKGPGYEVYVYETTHEILKTLGYHAAHAIIPALVPLYLNESNAPLGASRLREIPARFGYQTSQEFNPWPHPFP